MLVSFTQPLNLKTLCEREYGPIAIYFCRIIFIMHNWEFFDLKLNHRLSTKTSKAASNFFSANIVFFISANENIPKFR